MSLPNDEQVRCPYQRQRAPCSQSAIDCLSLQSVRRGRTFSPYFFVEEGAEISVESTIVPRFNIKPFSLSKSIT